MPITNEQLPDLMRMLAGTAEAIGGQLTPSAAAVMAGDLRQYELQAVSLALAEVRRSARGRFALSDVLRILSDRDGRPAPDEAWSIALVSFDESATVVTNQEIQSALAVARPVIDAGDKIGGRRTFLAAYERLVSEARGQAKRCEWQISLGSDVSGRTIAIQDAARLGRLSHQDASRYLEKIGGSPQPVTADGQAIAGLITGAVPRGKVSDNVREKLAELRNSIAKNSEADRAKAKASERQERAAVNARADQALGLGDGVLPDE